MAGILCAAIYKALIMLHYNCWETFLFFVLMFIELSMIPPPPPRPPPPPPDI